MDFTGQTCAVASALKVDRGCVISAFKAAQGICPDADFSKGDILLAIARAFEVLSNYSPQQLCCDECIEHKLRCTAMFEYARLIVGPELVADPKLMDFAATLAVIVAGDSPKNC